LSPLQAVNQLSKQVESSVVGQPQLVNRLLIALLVDGHLLVEGAPGLAKTRAIKALADCIETNFQRVQFTPDLLPADLTGTEVYRPTDGSFVFQQGPLFNNLILADEVNRAPAKVQSALLEAMAEQQISVGHQTYPLPTPFMVMATQNPIEQEGTYSLPEAQLDRFLMQVLIDYPDPQHEADILRLVRNITATRYPEQHDEELAQWIQYGASPRGTLALDACARAHAWLDGRDYVSPGDVQAIFHDVLRHRILLSFEAEADAVTANDVLERLLQLVAVP